MPVATSPLPASMAEVNQQNGGITVPMLLANPTRVTRQIAAVAAANYWADRVLPNGGGVTGGGVVYDLAQPGDNYSEDEPEQIPAGAEFPIINAAEPIPRTAKVAKWGGKIKIVDEKVQRNDIRYVQREQTRLANTMVRRLHRNAVEAIQEAITEFSRTAEWERRFTDIVITGTTPTDLRYRPGATVMEAQANADANDHNVNFDVLLVNTLKYQVLATNIYPAKEGGVNAGVFPDGRGGARGIVIGTPLVPLDKSYLIASNEAGETRWERPLYTTPFRREEEEAEYLQSGARVVMFVDNPQAILELSEPA